MYCVYIWEHLQRSERQRRLFDMRDLSGRPRPDISLHHESGHHLRPMYIWEHLQRSGRQRRLFDMRDLSGRPRPDISLHHESGHHLRHVHRRTVQHIRRQRRVQRVRRGKLHLRLRLRVICRHLNECHVLPRVPGWHKQRTRRFQLRGL